MAGTKAGGLKAAKTNKERHGDDFFKVIGARGGRNGHTGGFAANRELARAAGAKGGRISRRGSESEKAPLVERGAAEKRREKSNKIPRIERKLQEQQLALEYEAMKSEPKERKKKKTEVILPKKKGIFARFRRRNG